PCRPVANVLQLDVVDHDRTPSVKTSAREAAPRAATRIGQPGRRGETCSLGVDQRPRVEQPVTTKIVKLRTDPPELVKPGLETGDFRRPGPVGRPCRRSRRRPSEST